MKNKTIGKLMAATLAIAMVAGSPIGALEAHAWKMEQFDDGCVRSDKESGGLGDEEAIDINAGSGENTYVEEAPAPSYEAPSYEAPSTDSGSSSSVSYSAGSGNSSVCQSASNGGTTAAPAARYTGSATKATVPGYETWRQTATATAGTYTVTHCGVAQYTFQLKDADGNAVAYTSAKLKEIDKKWYINVVTAAGVDTTGYTVETTKGSESYLTKLGVAGVTLNDVVIVDPAAAVVAATVTAQ